MSRLVPSALELIPPCVPGPPYKKPRYGPVAIREVSVKTPWNQRGNFCFVSFSFKFPKTTRARPAGHEFSAGHIRVKNRVAQPPLTPSPTVPHRTPPVDRPFSARSYASTSFFRANSFKMAGGKKLTKEDEILLQNFSRTVSTKSSALFYANAFFVSAIPLCKFISSTFYFSVEIITCVRFFVRSTHVFLMFYCFRAVLEDSPDGSLLLWDHVRCNDLDQYVACSVCV